MIQRVWPDAHPVPIRRSTLCESCRRSRRCYVVKNGWTMWMDSCAVYKKRRRDRRE